MNRVDRLTAMLLYLQGGKRTAGEIARRFEVSRRTILRDIDALGEMGIPIVAELGSTGGYSLPPDYSLPPLALTLHEALLLRLALSSLSQLGDVPFKGERESLLLKIQTLLPRHERVNLEQLQQAVSLDVPSSRSYPTPFLDRLLKSAQEECWVSVSYCSEKGVSQQTLLPLRLRTTAGLWYCEAYSYERQATRVYRVDRFLEVKAAMEPPELERPATPILHVDSSYPEVHIFLTARGMLRLEHEPHLGPRLQRTEAGDGWLRLQLRPEEYDWLVSIVLGLGTDAKVLAPEELRLRVQQVVHEIAHNYAEL
ncbi:helix-turn-helix transcriptional regulator [Ktedonobacter racemifer]|uniref:Helix-turn-helix type 11 domain protein n=1 Tax=Ktedonobacter racemifer DSM 44963 TaxID=485913 RepID=D6TVU1_KTERA|nr:YafY family protein [Ktedonobacter racemifer]EFH84324.1 Helix-turn-helix type 11 domain protein [Ktedonobacter racemifer DSM 44963]